MSIFNFLFHREIKFQLKWIINFEFSYLAKNKNLSFLFLNIKFWVFELFSGQPNRDYDYLRKFTYIFFFLILVFGTGPRS